MDEERIKIVVHHTGHFVSDDNRQLKFGGQRAEWSCDPDLLSYFAIVASIKELGHMDVKELWLNDEVHLYVVHNTTEPEIIEMIDWVGGHVEDEGHGATQVEKGEVVGDGDGATQVEEGEGEGIIEVETEMGNGDGDEDAHIQEDAHIEGEGIIEVGTKKVECEEDAHIEEDAKVHQVQDAEVHKVQDAEVHHVEEVDVHDVLDFELEDIGEDEDEEIHESDGEEVHEVEADTEEEDADDEEVDVSDDILIDVSIDCDIGANKANSSRSTSDDGIDDVRGLSDNEWLSEEFISGPDSEDEDGSSKIRFPTFSMPKNLEAYKWEIGTYFAEKNEFTDAIRTYALSNARSLKFIKNDKKRISVKCMGGKGNCKWYAYCFFRPDVDA
ncbi:hypothetical protein V8G54_003969 [Vigna mungo]|uniref:Transposase MuDR plant domain-containing protein n=1 Tax=Vigna mungo TaxID=3915 RepID=A0AAQ3PBF0_VIGMU